jgi:PAT family beta-lactamase induction signal transducer AmpG
MSESAPSTPEEKKGPKSPHAWVSSTYFAEGFPYSVIHNIAEILFKEMGASLQAIGLTSLFHLPWNLKFLWGPFLDSYATKRRWLIWMEALITLTMVILAFSTTLPNVLAVASVVFVFMALLSATHDIAIDGYYLEGLDEEGQSRFVGYRAMAYRLATLLVGGPLIFLISLVGWFYGLLATSAVMALLWGYHHRYLPKIETPQRPIRDLFSAIFRLKILLVGVGIATLIASIRWIIQTDFIGDVSHAISSTLPWINKISTSGWIGLGLLAGLFLLMTRMKGLRRRMTGSDSRYAAAFVDFLEQKHVGRILAFVVLFRTGESFLVKMRYPFFSDAGMSLGQYGFASGTVGLICSFTATLLGGYLISRDGLKKWLWPFVLLQNVLNLLFAGVAYAYDGGAITGESHLWIFTTVISIEAIGSGLGTAVFMVYLMRCCRPQHKAAHMAIVTALMSVSFTLAGVVSGFLANWMGFAHYFVLSFFAAIPGMLLIPFIPYLDGTSASSTQNTP